MWWNHQINLNNYNKFVKLLLFFDYFQELRRLTTILKVIMIKKGCDNEIGITTCNKKFAATAFWMLKFFLNRNLSEILGNPFSPIEFFHMEIRFPYFDFRKFLIKFWNFISYRKLKVCRQIFYWEYLYFSNWNCAHTHTNQRSGVPEQQDDEDTKNKDTEQIKSINNITDITTITKGKIFRWNCNSCNQMFKYSHKYWWFIEDLIQ